MTFGMEKITAKEMVDAILAVIKDDLMKSDCFSNPSLAYYGVEIDYTHNIKLHSRGLNKVQVRGSHQLGHKTDEEPRLLKIKNKASAGRKVVVAPGSHVRDRMGVEV